MNERVAKMEQQVENIEKAVNRIEEAMVRHVGWEADKYDEIEKLLHDFKYKEGFKIIGLEQTSESQRLGAEGTTFSEKSVILLGAEKTGIPVELLTCLDQCVEIPQAGVTRSLNVHVSAAIFMWDYVRQELDKM